MSDLEAVGERIRIARQIKRWSQVRLAEEVGVNHQSVARWEKGLGLKLEQFLRVAYALGVAPEDFFDLAPQTISNVYPRRREEDWEFDEKAAVPKSGQEREPHNQRARKAA